MGYSTQVTKPTKQTTILRKKERFMGDLSNGDKFLIIKMYIDQIPYNDIASKYNVSSKNIRQWLGKFTRSISAAQEIHQLTHGIQSSKVDRPTSSSVSISSNFIDMLSDEDDDMLNEAENIYVQEWCLYGNNGKAISAAGFDKDTDKGIAITRHLKFIRGQYLRRRPKIQKAIEREEQSMLSDMASSKEFVQKTLIQTIRELQEDVGDNRSNRNNLLKSIELLGKTIPSTFTETLRTEEVSPKSTLQLLMKKVEAKKVEEIEAGTYHAE